jgi:hypothetical protein
MRSRVNRFGAVPLLFVLQALPFLPFAPRASADEAGPPVLAVPGEDDAGPPPEDDVDFGSRWIASLAITGGAIFQNQDGAAESEIFEDGSATPVELQPSVKGDDFVFAPFVGAALEVLSPELPVKTTPRFFISGEILPSFSTERQLASEGEPGCIRGPEPQAPCAKDEQPGSRRLPFGEEAANGEATRTVAEIDTLVFGANLGVAFPIEAWSRQIRIKPSVAWINYKVNARGLVVDATCEPPEVCTDVYTPGNPDPVLNGFLREARLSASDSQRFNGVGPALDVEVDTGRFGPIGSSLFLGARFYRVLGDRNVEFGTSQSFDDPAGTDTAAARFGIEVNPWLYRAHVGVRFHWLGLRN